MASTEVMTEAHDESKSHPMRKDLGITAQIRGALLVALLLVTSVGCQLIPEVAYEPVVHNPFPQLTRVAVAPFFNTSDEPTVDGRQFALAYFAELQSVPGFEVIPLSQVEAAIEDHAIDLSGPESARRLAQILGADAVVIGAVTDFVSYYPPQCGLEVEWWSANPCFHSIPPGYGLPWGTSEEEFIPAPLVFEAEMALARAQLKTQAPSPHREVSPPPETIPPAQPTSASQGPPHSEEAARREQPLLPTEPVLSLPANWPDARGFVPPGPSPQPPLCITTQEPVMRHTRIYNGTDSELTQALASYHFFRDDARIGGWQSYLRRSDDFIRFCCRMHISEMLSARGGAGETRVVWRWSPSR